MDLKEQIKTAIRNRELDINELKKSLESVEGVQIYEVCILRKNGRIMTVTPYLRDCKVWIELSANKYSNVILSIDDFLKETVEYSPKMRQMFPLKE